MRKAVFSAVLALLPLLAAGVASAQSTLISSRTFNGPGGSHDVFYAAKAAPGGGYYLAGYTSSTATGADIWVLKVDAGLNVVSSATFNGSANGFDTAYGIGLSSAGDVYVVGASSNTGIGMVWWLGRYDSNLVRLASATYTFGFSDTNTSCDSVFVKADGTVIAMGDIYTSASASGSRVWTVRFSPNFNIQATFGYSAGFGPEYADSIHVTPSGEYYKFGALAPAALTSTNLFIARTDSSDVGISTVIVAGAGGNTDQARGGALGSNGDLYVTGIMNNAGLYTDAWLARYTPTLTFVSSRNVAGSATNHHQGNDLAQGPAGTFVVTGALNNAGSSDDIWIAEVWENDLGIKSSSTVTSAGSNSDIGYALVVDTAAGAALVAGVMTAATQDGWVGLFNVSAASATPPAAPSAFAGSASSTTSVQWSWTDNSSDETGFRVKLGGSNLSGDLAANTTSWLQTGLTPNATSGLLLVQAFNSSGTADSSSLQRYSLADPPNSISATFFGSSVTLTWPTLTNPPSTRWSVERGSDGVNYSQLSLSSVTASYTDIGLSAATTYYYRIRAANQDDVYSSHANASAIVFTGSNPPTAPSAFNGVPQSTSTVLWTWLDNSANETGFRVLRGTVNYSGNLAANTTSWLETGLAVNTAGGSLTLQVYGSSGTANSSTTWTRYSLAEAPTSFTATAVHVTSAAFSWNTGANPLGGQTSFHVYRSTTGLWTPIVVNAGVFSTMTLTDLTAATSYFFRIRAQNFDGYYTAYDSTVTFLTGASSSPAPTAPTNFGAVAVTTSTVRWFWTDNATTETGYRLLLGTANYSGDLPAGTTSWLETGLGFNASGGALSLQVFHSSGATTSTHTVTRYSLAANPHLLATSAVHTTSAAFSWNAGGNPLGGVTYFHLRRSLNAAFSGESIYPLIQVTTAGMTGLAPQTTYYVRMLAGNVDGINTTYVSTISFVTGAAVSTAPTSGTPAVTVTAVSPSSGVVGASPSVTVTGSRFISTTTLALERLNGTGSWAAGPSIYPARDFSLATRLDDGRILVTGGMHKADASIVLSTTTIYDPVTSTWTIAAPMGTTRHNFALLKLNDGRVLAVGGHSAGLVYNASAEIYDPATDTWTPTGSFSLARAAADGVVLPDGRVLIAGGFDGTVRANVDLYDPATGSWTARSPLNAARANVSLNVLNDGRVIAVGGLPASGSSAAAEIYDPALNTWTTVSSMTISRYAHRSVVLPDGRVMIIGGSSFALGAQSTAEIYDPVADSWMTTPSMDIGRYHPAVELLGGRVIVAGGLNASSATASVQAYDPATNTWTTLASMATPRFHTSLVRMSDDRLMLIAGEGTASAVLSSVELLTVPLTSIAATGVSVTNSTSLSATFPLAGAATGYWDVVARGPGAGRLPGGFRVNAPRLTTLAVSPSTASLATGAQIALTATGTFDDTSTQAYTSLVLWTSSPTSVATVSTGGVVTALAPGTALIAASSGAVVAYATVTVTAVPPTAPSGFAGVALGSASIRWSWTDNSSDETGFRVMAGTVSLSGDLAANATTWLQTGLASSTVYGPYFARVFNSTGTADSGASTATTQGVVPPPAAPSAFAGAAVSTSSILWSWTDNASDETGFRVMAGTISLSGDLAANATSWLQTGLSSSTLYGPYFARVFNSTGTADSAVSSATTAAIPPAPTMPTSFSGTALSPTALFWTWLDNATNETAYRVHSGTVNLSGDLAVNASSWTQTGLTPNTSYGPYFARVLNSGGAADSSPATQRTLAAAPTGSAVSSFTATVATITWSLNGNPATTTAEVHRSTDNAVFALFYSSAATFLRDASLLGCTSYYYKARYVNGAAVATAFDATVLVRTADTVPASPASLTAEAVAGGRIFLSWVGSPTEGVTGYRLFSDGGTGAFNFGSPLAVFTSTESSYTTGVLTSSAAYSFVLRAAHRCGSVETAGVSAAAASTATLAAVRASIKNPDAGKRINGNSVTIMAELTAGTPSQVSQVRFQFRASTSAPWTDITAANVNHPNPDLQAPYFVHWNVTAIAAGSYELRAVAYDASGAPDPAPGAITVTVTAASPDITENIVGGDIQKSQALNNAVVNTVATGGGDANDPLAKIVLPPGALNSSTVTVTVEANPTITTAPPSGLTAVGSYLRIDLDNGQHELSNGQTACITMSYPSSGVDPSRLQIYSYDNVSSSWKKDFSSAVNTSSRTITGCTPHFSVFAVFAGVATTTMLDSVRVYPNPYKPNSGNPDTGKPFTAGDGTSGIIFDNLPAAVVIEIYSLSGRRVARFDTTASGGLIRWDARNTDGRDVASGGYFAVISSQGLKPSVKKLFIIR